MGTADSFLFNRNSLSKYKSLGLTDALSFKPLQFSLCLMEAISYVDCLHDKDSRSSLYPSDSMSMTSDSMVFNYPW